MNMNLTDDWSLRPIAHWPGPAGVLRGYARFAQSDVGGPLFPLSHSDIAGSRPQVPGTMLVPHIALVYTKSTSADFFVSSN